jgi:DNA relaxase NicK
MSISQFKLDWLSGTTHDFSLDWVLKQAEYYFPFLHFEMVKPRYPQYSRQFDFVQTEGNGRHVSFSILDGTESDMGVFLVASGECAQEIKPLFDNLNCQPSRIDTALDYCEPDGFDIVTKFAIAKAQDNDYSPYPAPIVRGVSTVGDWFTDGSPKGRTLYIGSRKSKFFIRIYEKGKQVGGDPNWFRIELEFKPQSPAQRLLASDLTPHQIAELDPWLTGLLNDLFVFGKYDWIPLPTKKTTSDFEKKRCYMVHQYAEPVLDFLNECADLEQAIERLETIRKRQKNHHGVIVPCLADTF